MTMTLDETVRDRTMDVLAAELDRSMRLHLEGAPRPYFIQYTLRRVEELEWSGAYGSLYRERSRTDSRLFADLRVGNRKFDNMLDGGLEVEARDRESAGWTGAPDDLDPTALQARLWKLTQIRFDEAVEDYYEHRKALVAEYIREEVDALSQERPLRRIADVDVTPWPATQWATMARELSARFTEHPHLYDPSVRISARREHRWIATSEGARVFTTAVYIEAEVTAWVLTEDGVYAEASRRFHARRLSDAPTEAQLRTALDEVLAECEELRTAEPLGAFIGPALLSGQAASTLFHEALGHRLEGERLVARGETRTFAHKRGERILPAGVHVYDDPTANEEGAPVWGGYDVDDQGVRAQRAELVRDGVLVGFLRSRTPIPGDDRSNGHGRHDGTQGIMARMGHLVVEPGKGDALGREALEAKLIELAKSMGRPQALLIDRIDGGETTTSSYDFQVFKGEPSEVYVIDVATGQRRRVRDVSLIGTPLSALQRVVAVGERAGDDRGYCYAESGAIPVSGRAPAMLLSELELQQSSTSAFREPLLPPPFAEKS